MAAIPHVAGALLEHHTGLKLFGDTRGRFDALGTAKLAPLWDAIMAVPRPEPAEMLDVPGNFELSTT